MPIKKTCNLDFYGNDYRVASISTTKKYEVKYVKLFILFKCWKKCIKRLDKFFSIQYRFIQIKRYYTNWTKKFIM